MSNGYHPPDSRERTRNYTPLIRSIGRVNEVDYRFRRERRDAGLRSARRMLSIAQA